MNKLFVCITPHTRASGKQFRVWDEIDEEEFNSLPETTQNYFEPKSLRRFIPVRKVKGVLCKVCKERISFEEFEAHKEAHKEECTTC